MVIRRRSGRTPSILPGLQRRRFFNHKFKEVLGIKVKKQKFVEEFYKEFEVSIEDGVEEEVAPAAIIIEGEYRAVKAPGRTAVEEDDNNPLGLGFTAGFINGNSYINISENRKKAGLPTSDILLNG
jgi:hypothetical protein